MRTLLFALLGISLFVALTAIPAAILMVLLGVLASLTGWTVAIGFAPCFIIALIIGLFFSN